MRRILVAGATTASGLVLLMSYPTSMNHTLPGAVPPGAATSGDGSSASGSAGGTVPGTGSAPSTGSTTTQPSTAPSGTYTGASVGTRWGNVQVEITVENGQVVDARAVRVPDGNSMDQQINSYAVPVLEAETLEAGSARIDAVTGATVTSDGYIASLQSALDQAGLR